MFAEIIIKYTIFIQQFYSCGAMCNTTKYICMYVYIFFQIQLKIEQINHEIFHLPQIPRFKFTYQTFQITQIFNYLLKLNQNNGP